MGVSWPTERPGYWLGHARTSRLESHTCRTIWALRLHPTTGAPVCSLGQQATLRSDGVVACIVAPGLDQNDLYACTTGLELYECPVPDICLGGSSVPHTVVQESLVPSRRLRTANSSCREGHSGVLCALCEPGYVANSRQLCELCPENKLQLYGIAVVVVLMFIALGYRVRSGGGSAASAPTRPASTTPRSAKGGVPMRAYMTAFVQGTMKQPYKVCG